MKPDNEKYQIISPDGLPITDEPFESKQAALHYIPRWRERFERQGYYKAIGGRIPLDELTGRLTIVPDSETVDVMDEINRQQTTWNDDVLARLMENAEDFARITMSKFGEVPPTLLMANQNGVSGFSRPDLSDDEKKKEFLTTGRMICIAQEVEAAVLCSSGWMRLRDNGEVAAAVIAESPEQDEVAILVGESREGRVQKFLSVQRSDDEEFLGFGRVSKIGDAKVTGEFGQFLSQEVPDEDMRLRAKAFLEAKGLSAVNGMQHGNGSGRSVF